MAKEQSGQLFRPAWFGPATIRGVVASEGKRPTGLARGITPVDSELMLEHINISEVRGMLESNYPAFAPAVKRLKAQLVGLKNPADHPRHIPAIHPRHIGGKQFFSVDDTDTARAFAFRIRSEDIFDTREYVVRLVFGADAKKYEEKIVDEEWRYDALERGLFIDPRYRDRIEHIVASDPESYITVTELMPGNPISQFSHDKQKLVGLDPIREGRDAILAMVECGIVPDPNPPNTLITVDSQHFNFVDYVCITDWKNSGLTWLHHQGISNFYSTFSWFKMESFERERQLSDVGRERDPYNWP